MRSLEEEDELLVARNPGNAVKGAVKVAGNFGKDLAHTVLTAVAVDKAKQKLQPHREPNPAVSQAINKVTGPHNPQLVK
jgi:hypothetical protein